MKNRYAVLAAAVMTAGSLHGLAVAAPTYTFNKTTSVAWNSATNWDASNGGTTFPQNVGDVAIINTQIGAETTLSLNQAITVGQMTIGDSDGTHAFVVAAGTSGSLTFDNGASAPATLTIGSTGTAGANRITAPITLNRKLQVLGGVNNGNLLTLSGDITGTGELINNSASGITITGGVKSFQGTVTANSFATGSNIGTITLTTGSLANAAEIVINGYVTSGFTQNGGVVHSGNGSSAAVDPGQRLTSNRITMRGGSLNAVGQALAATPASNATDVIEDTVANFDLDRGYSLVLVSGSGSSGGTNLNLTTLERDQGASLYVRSSTLAGLGSGKAAKVFVGNSSTFLVGGSGAEGTTNMKIFPFIVAANTNGSAANPSTFATYTANGIRALTTGASSESAQTFTAGTVSDLNVEASPSLLSGNTTFNSLRYSGTSATNLGLNRTLTLTSGGLLFGGNNGGIGQVANSAAGTLDFGAAEGVIYSLGNNSNTIGAVVAGADGVTKSGTGTLILTGANTYDGPTHVSSGTLQLGDGTSNTVTATLGDVADTTENHDVVVHAGSLLNININASANNGINTINDRAALDLDAYGLFNGKLKIANGIETVAALYLGDTAMPEGYYGSAAAISANNSVTGATLVGTNYFDASGLGLIRVVAVPEPASIGLLALGGLFALRRRRVLN